MYEDAKREVAYRRTRFADYISSPPKTVQQRCLCPCCGYPTLHTRGGFGFCVLDWWEDDGQDDEDATTVRGGPNHDYSLAEARENFRRHRTMYRPSHEGPFSKTASVEQHALKRDLIDAYEQLAAAPASETLWHEIKRLENALHPGRD